MPTIRVFHDFVTESSAPLWIRLTFEPDEINWELPYLYIHLGGPFLPDGGDIEEQLAISVYLEELTTHPNKDGHIGIHLASLQARLPEGLEPADILHFTLRLCDLEEVLQTCMKNSFPADMD